MKPRETNEEAHHEDLSSRFVGGGLGLSAIAAQGGDLDDLQGNFR
ncbi:MAG: hypothetical protein OJF50_003841 [Nitrospira sp.]|nr:hypothetical protein [Nitrospira sp.]